MDRLYLNHYKERNRTYTKKWLNSLNREIVDNANHIIKRCYENMEALPKLLNVLELLSKKM